MNTVILNARRWLCTEWTVLLLGTNASTEEEDGYGVTTKDGSSVSHVVAPPGDRILSRPRREEFPRRML
jgi:hypothetical protein